VAGRALQHIDFVSADGAPLPGLVPVRGQGLGSLPLTIDEQAAVSEAASFREVDFVFFRRFSDGRSSHVAAYIVDNSPERLNEQALAELHHQLWLHGVAPLLYVAWPTRVDVMACARAPDFWEDDECRFKPAESIDTAADIDAELTKRSRFSAFRLADGTFWDDPRNSALASHDKAAHQSLIRAVVDADNGLGGDRSPVLRRLLLLMVLIKYLEDRRVFPNGWFGRFHKGARSFFDVLRAEDPAKAERLLDFLERRFNGDVFKLPVNGRHRLTQGTLRRFAELVEGRTLRRQRYLWQQFSFEHLPVEIISHLYQRFVKGGHGTVYTPPFLASLLFDHAMPYERLTGKERVLDPACGSGVFLVGAFRRLINVWRSQNNWQRPEVATLKRILRESIFGVELEPDAIDLTAFSLALAVCDALKPEVIWKDLKLDPLRGSNLVEGDFFELVLNRSQRSHTILDQDFDIVLGNPPFVSALTDPGELLNKNAQQDNPDRGRLPDNQAAYLFLEQALETIPSDACVCLIQPHGLLYNRKAQPFGTFLWNRHRVEAILDFTSIRNLYTADPKTVAVCATVGPPAEDHLIEHLTFRRTFSVHERICFELDHYDRHRVPQQTAVSRPHVWRVNLLGGGRLVGVSERIRSMPTLEQYVDEAGWDYGEGFIVGNRKREAPFLTGKPFLPTRALTESGIDEAKIGVVKESRFEGPRREELYTPPLVLIKENQSLPSAFWDKGYLTFRDKIVSIHAPRCSLVALQGFYETFRKRQETYRFCCTLNGSQSLVGKATAILKQDIDALPCPENPDELRFSFWEEALRDDVLEYMADYIRLGQNSDLLRRPAEMEHLREYSRLFRHLLGSVYDNLKADEAVFLDGLICQPFYFGERPSAPWLTGGSTDALRELVYHQNHEHLRTVRVLRFYVENALLIVKPDRLRYWIRSTAIRDADETLVDLRQQGY
jgi:hypothetical protein